MSPSLFLSHALFLFIRYLSFILLMQPLQISYSLIYSHALILALANMEVVVGSCVPFWAIYINPAVSFNSINNSRKPPGSAFWSIVSLNCLCIISNYLTLVYFVVLSS